MKFWKRKSFKAGARTLIKQGARAGLAAFTSGQSEVYLASARGLQSKFRSARMKFGGGGGGGQSLQSFEPPAQEDQQPAWQQPLRSFRQTRQAGSDGVKPWWLR